MSDLRFVQLLHPFSKFKYPVCLDIMNNNFGPHLTVKPKRLIKIQFMSSVRFGLFKITEESFLIVINQLIVLVSYDLMFNLRIWFSNAFDFMFQMVGNHTNFVFEGLTRT